MKNKVLLIDDSITIHRVIDLSIDLEKYDIIKVFSQEAATPKLSELKFEFILLDNKLENTTISEYVQNIKNMQPASKLILLVGAFDKFDPDDLSKTGADDYLVKPFDSQSLNMKLTGSARVNNEPKAGKPADTQKIAKHEQEINPAFLKNMGSDDIAREETKPPKSPPTPVNMDTLFHDPSVNPSKAESKGNQTTFHKTTSPFGEEETESENEFDPDSVFAGFTADGGDENPLTQNEASSSDETFGIPTTTSIKTQTEKPLPAESHSTQDNPFEETNDVLDFTQGNVFASLGLEDGKKDDGVTLVDTNERNKKTAQQTPEESTFGGMGAEFLAKTQKEENQSSGIDSNTTQTAPISEPHNINTSNTQSNSDDETDLYQLNEDSIFDKKPVTQIFEEEILSLETPEKETTAKPLAQKFEEEVLSIDEAKEEGKDNGAAQGKAEDDFFDASNLDATVEGAQQSRTISQKFEEEILSISDSADNDIENSIQNDQQTPKPLQETFEEEILSLSGAENAMETEHSSESDENAFTKEFADEIFPKDDDAFDFGALKDDEDDFILKAAAIEDETSFDFESEIGMIETIETIEINGPTDKEPLKDLSQNDTKISYDKPSIMDENLELDKLLAMDFDDEPKEIIEPNVTYKPEIKETEPSFDELDEIFNEEDDSVTSTASEPEDDIFENIDSKNTHEEADNFDVILPDSATPNQQHNFGENIFSGITVTISKEEIMKMLGNAIDKHFLEKAVQEVLAQNMREIVRTIVPAIAEKFIKEEIEKLKDEGEDI